MTHTFLQVLFALCCWHALADFALQNDFIANAKNRNTDLGKNFWRPVLLAHALIHGIGVNIITGSLLLGLAEVAVHFVIDLSKCDAKITFNQDQSLHYFCKLLWTICVFYIPFFYTY